MAIFVKLLEEGKSEFHKVEATVDRNRCRNTIFRILV